MINGIATLGVGLASAFLFSTVFASIASLQAQVGAIQGELFIADNQIVFLQTQVATLNTQVALLQTTNAELQVKCAFLNGPYFSSDLIVGGNIQQLIPFGINVFAANTLIEDNLVVTGNIINPLFANYFTQFSF